MDLEPHINRELAAHMEAVTAAASLGPALARAAQAIVASLLNGGRLIACGNGGGAALAEHFVGLLSHHYQRERPGLPALALGASGIRLSALADELGFSQVFASQLHALGHPGDILLVLTTHGQSDNILYAIEAATERQIQVVAFTGCDGGRVPGRLREQDVEIRVPHEHSARIHEVQMLGLHCLCELIDVQLLGS